MCNSVATGMASVWITANNYALQKLGSFLFCFPVNELHIECSLYLFALSKLWKPYLLLSARKCIILFIRCQILFTYCMYIKIIFNIIFLDIHHSSFISTSLNRYRSKDIHF